MSTEAVAPPSSFLSEALRCPICISTLSKPIVVLSPCMHKFCYLCIKPWLESHRSCPICRKKVDAATKDCFAENILEYFYELNPGIRTTTEEEKFEEIPLIDMEEEEEFSDVDSDIVIHRNEYRSNNIIANEEAPEDPPARVFRMTARSVFSYWESRPVRRRRSNRITEGPTLTVNRVPAPIPPCDLNRGGPMTRQQHRLQEEARYQSR